MMKGFLLGLLSLLGVAAPIHAQQPLSLNTFAGPPLSTVSRNGYYDLILLEAFSRLKIPIIIGHLPAERSLQNADRGIDDGDFVRIAGLERRYRNLVMVPEQLDDFEFVAFSTTVNLTGSSWAALAPYHVGIVRGWKILEENLVGVKKLTSVKNQEQLFTLLKNGRVDVVIYARHEGYGLVRQLGIANCRVQDSPLAVRPMHLYLNKKHTGLVAPLAAVLKKMKEEGVFANIGRQTLPAYVFKEDDGAHP